MKRIALATALAALLAAPAAFAQSATFTTGGPIFIEGAATSKPIHGAVIAEAPVLAAPGSVATVASTSVLGAGPSVTVVRHYWNVPADINSRSDFRRWVRLQ